MMYTSSLIDRMQLNNTNLRSISSDTSERKWLVLIHINGIR
jgi:hypothetical protein